MLAVGRLGVDRGSAESDGSATAGGNFHLAGGKCDIVGHGHGDVADFLSVAAERDERVGCNEYHVDVPERAIHQRRKLYAIRFKYIGYATQFGSGAQCGANGGMGGWGYECGRDESRPVHCSSRAE